MGQILSPYLWNVIIYNFKGTTGFKMHSLKNVALRKSWPIKLQHNAFSSHRL